MKSKIPGRVPGILPLVRHGDDIGIVEVWPVVVADALMALGRRRLGRITFEPSAEIVVVELLGPQHTRKSLALHIPCIASGGRGYPLGVKLVCVGDTFGKDRFEF